jgi:dinuclear metal center YbgI/SA1388 family protein
MRHAQRVRTLLSSNIALYAAHIPLDVHPEVGNNVTLARQIGMGATEPFGDFLGVPLGMIGSLELPLADLVQRIGTVLGVEPRLIAGGDDAVRRVAVVTGAGGGYIQQAHEAGADTYVTGEGAHHTFFDAEELAMNVIYAGHYATETVGVIALARHLADQFNLPWDFIDHPTGL